MMTTFFPFTVYVGFPHLHSSVIASPASTRRIAAISAFHRSRYAISMLARPSTIIWDFVLTRARPGMLLQSPAIRHADSYSQATKCSSATFQECQVEGCEYQ